MKLLHPMSVFIRTLPLLLLPWLLGSCAGYKLGEAKPHALRNVKKVSVPMFYNNSLHPRAEALATSAVASAMTQDGTYRITNLDQADAVLEGTIRNIKYSPLRGSRLDTLQSVEMTNTVVLSWQLRDARNPTKILASGESEGSSQLFVSSNLQTSKNNALPEALERAGEALVSVLANGY